MKVLICGLGAIGSIYADKIQRYDSDSLRILVDAQRLERYTKNPPVFNGRELYLNYVLPHEKNFKVDLILIATKSDGLERAVKDIKNFVHNETLILSLLNGVASEDVIAEAYGRAHVLDAYFIGNSAVRTGRYVEHEEGNTIVFAHNEKLAQYFDKVGINYQNPPDIRRAMWLKFMLNAASNQGSAVFHLTFGEMCASEKFMDFAKKVMAEVQALAKAEGISNTETMIEEVIEMMRSIKPEGKTSMLQDIEAGRKTEIDILAGTIIELGRKHGIPTPYNKVLKDLITLGLPIPSKVAAVQIV